MAVRNWNLGITTLPIDASATTLVIDEVWGDSQMAWNQIRLTGQWATANLPFTGRLLGFLSTASTGVSLTLPNNSGFAGITHQTDGSGNLYLRPGDVWSSDGNSTDHFSFSVGWDFATTGTNVRQLAILTVQESTLYTGSFPLANQRLWARVFYRNTPKCPNFRVYPHRNGLRGGFDLVTPSGKGGIAVYDKSIAATAPSSGAEPAGVEIWTNGDYTAGDALEILGVLIYASDSGSIVNNGYVHFPIFKSGATASSLAASVSTEAIDALHSTMNVMRGAGTKAADLIQFEFGHNNDGAGYTTGLETLRTKVANSHIGGGFGVPDYLFWAMWSYDGNQARMSTQADDLFTFCDLNGYGFINLFDTYNGVDPATNGARFDGTPATYIMDGANLHPGDSATAKLIVQDIEEHWQPANIVLGFPPTLVSTTPANNATGVLDTQTLGLQFSENIALNDGSALIEVYQGGSQVASDRADNGLINVADKTEYSLSGLLTGLSGPVSIRISPNAFESLSTGVAFAGITDDTTLNFTIGGSGSPTRMVRGVRGVRGVRRVR